MPPIGIAPHPKLRKMTNGSLIGTIIAFHLFALPFVIIAIYQIMRRPGNLYSYAALLPAILFLGCAYTDYLGELLRRRRINKGGSSNEIEHTR
jgi:hypothetical protein